MIIEPKGIIIHSMSEYIDWDGETLYAKEFLKRVGLSVHGLIKPDGTYDKMIESPNKASHAGISKHYPYKFLNSHYLGFELLLTGNNDYVKFLQKINEPNCYTEQQFNTAIEVCKWWMEEYNIPVDRVVRHSDVSGDDVRGQGKGKKDPGDGFDWDRFKSELES